MLVICLGKNNESFILNACFISCYQFFSQFWATAYKKIGNMYKKQCIIKIVITVILVVGTGNVEPADILIIAIL